MSAIATPRTSSKSPATVPATSPLALAISRAPEWNWSGWKALPSLGALVVRVERVELAACSQAEQPHSIFRFAPTRDIPGCDRAHIGHGWPSMTSYRTRYCPRNLGVEVDHPSFAEVDRAMHGDRPALHAQERLDRVGSFDR
jgi:hypothetical protein